MLAGMFPGTEQAAFVDTLKSGASARRSPHYLALYELGKINVILKRRCIKVYSVLNRV